MIVVEPPPRVERSAPAPLGRSPRMAALVLLATALMIDLSIRTRGGGLAAMAAILCLCAGLVACGAVRRPVARVLLAGAAVVSVLIFLRASPWLIALDLGAAFVLLALACSSEEPGRWLDSRFGAMARRVSMTLVSIMVALPRALATLFTLTPRGTPSSRFVASILRGLLIAVPLTLFLGVLLAQADPVFASLLDLDVDLDVGDLLAQATLVTLGVWVAAGFFVEAERSPVELRPQKRSLGPIEGLVVMSSLVAVYGVFAISQALVQRRGPEYVAETTGVTYAEYARSGFFQLLWVAALTALVLVCLRVVVRRPTPFARRAFALLGVTAAGLTIVIVQSALHRLDLYERAFGLTRLRFYSTAFAWWLGAVFVLVGISFIFGGGHGKDGDDRGTAPGFDREWLPSAVLGSAFVALLVVNIVNPDRFVLEHNIAAATTEGAELDVVYIQSLSSDSIPSLVELLPTLPASQRWQFQAELCRRASSDEPVSWNVSAWQADRAVAEICGGP